MLLSQHIETRHSALSSASALMGSARQSLLNSRKNEAMRDLLRSAGWQWAGAMLLGLALLKWSRTRVQPAVGAAVALALWALAAWAARVPWPFADRAFEPARFDAHPWSQPAGFVLVLAGAAVLLLIAVRAAPKSRTRATPSDELSSRLSGPGVGHRAGLATAARPLGQRPRGEPLSGAVPPGPSVAGHADLVGPAVRAAAARARARLDAVDERRDRAPRPAAARVLAHAGYAGACDARRRRRARLRAVQHAPADFGAGPRVVDRRRRVVLLPARRPVGRTPVALGRHRRLGAALPVAAAVCRIGADRCDAGHARHGAAVDRRVCVGCISRRVGGDVVASAQRQQGRRHRAGGRAVRRLDCRWRR